jgi:hypothetical protein
MKIFVASILIVFFAFGLVPFSEGAPSLVGTWTGIWSGGMETSLRLTVDSHKGSVAEGTLVLNNQSDIFAFTGAAAKDKDGKLTLKIEKLVLRIETPGGRIEKEKEFSFDLVLTGENTLEGTGKSRRHEGPVRLKRSR